ncbi:MAG: UDP-N-acetylmuramoyl-L-alanine--D-glutamate ligase [Victivallales bacterium]|nr:UDP-N-acetylmuramoyl-L-alanine--D-glutamate ligase [Victivallales bacterium]
MANFKGDKVIVLGGGASGIAAAELCASMGKEAVLLDSVSLPKCAAELEAKGIRCIGGPDALEYSEVADFAIISPGVPMDCPLAKLGQNLCGNVIGELEFGAMHLDVPILAVTGTNGKTTTVEMLNHILNGCGLKAIAAGNIGLPLCRVALQKTKLDALVAEVSSFQLEFPGDFVPRAAALLNITPDHLERHYTMEEYSRLKLSLRGMVKGGSFIVQSETAKAFNLAGEGIVLFGENGRDFFLKDGAIFDREDGLLAKTEELPFQGIHNYENAMAAIALAREVGVEPKQAAAQLRTFKVGDHRLQTVLKAGKLTFIDDSKATNVDALCAALKALEAKMLPITLIAGGLDKACTLEMANRQLAAQVSKVFLIGSSAERIFQQWNGIVPCEICGGMEEAVRKAACFHGGREGIVLLSPACSSLDIYKSYAERGDCFKAAAEKYINGAGQGLS